MDKKEGVVDKDHIIKVLQDHVKPLQQKLPEVLENSPKLDYLYEVQLKRDILEKTEK